ncbi:28S ribosomal protein S9, mitochondrial [Tetranychus urticae]|uniref:28S ribosomal protein S9, mitochondrial n=1 Tax=Tetranychus urticae TaxID=32264 RepID=T1KLR7_TETUR|nr:28S ribosomal protein S9, mitochondrial [Tetranychus urticae]
MLFKRIVLHSSTNRLFASSNTPSKLPKDLLRKPSQALSELGLGKLERISLSMKIYLESAQKNAEMINKQREEYELGKRHLANIMGFDYNSMTETNIKEAIKYLLPSGLFSKASRPEFLSPEEVYPKIRSADFDTSGRPYHFLAYTGKPNLYEDMHDLYDYYQKCDEQKLKMMVNGVLNPPPSAKAELTGSRWLTRQEYQSSKGESVQKDLWNQLTTGLERLADHPYSKEAQDFLMKFRVELEKRASTLEIAPITFNEEGRPYAQAEGFRKHCKAKVTVWGNGSGNIDINGYDILYFPQFKERHQILFPLLFTNMLNKVDIEATVEGVGEAAQAGAIRHGTSLALTSFLDPHMIESMRLAGLLTKDRRILERKKVGMKGARKTPKFRPR